MPLLAYLKVLGAELPVKDINVADHMVLTGCLGNDTGAMLQSPLNAYLQRPLV